MPKINHTPGPWLIVKDEAHFRAFITTRETEGKTIAEVPYFPRQRALFYNAALLAAATDLLAVPPLQADNYALPSPSSSP